MESEHFEAIRVCSWRLCASGKKLLIQFWRKVPNLNKEGPGARTLHLDVRVDRDHGGSVWSSPREWCSTCDWAIISFCTVNVGQRNNAQQKVPLSWFVSCVQKKRLPFPC